MGLSGSLQFGENEWLQSSRKQATDVDAMVSGEEHAHPGVKPGRSSKELREKVRMLRIAVEDRSRELERETRRREQVENELGQQHEQWQAALDEARQRAQGLAAALAQRNRSLEELQARYASLQRQWQDQSNLLEARTAESQVAQTFLTKVDTLSATEVRSMVGDLNTDIFQAAAGLAELFTLSIRPGELVAGVERARADMQERWLGQDLCTILANTQDASILLIAIQGVICGCCKEIIHRWPCFRSQDGHVEKNQECKTLYRNIRAQEVQAVAGRWRSLTRAHLRSWDKGGEAELEHYLPLVAEEVKSVYLLTGCVSPEDLSSGGRTVYKSLSGIVQLALRIRNTLGEDITSCDFEVIAAPQGQPFDSQFMDEDGGDEFGPQGHSSDTQVLCTTELGLMRTERVRSGSKENHLRQDIVANCKVALSSLLQPPEVPAQTQREQRRRQKDKKAQHSDKTSKSRSTSGKGARKNE